MQKRHVWGGSRLRSAQSGEVQETAGKRTFPEVLLALFLPVHTQLYSPFMGSNNLSHPTYILIVKEELLIASRPLPGYLQRKGTG